MLTSDTSKLLGVQTLGVDGEGVGPGDTPNLGHSKLFTSSSAATSSENLTPDDVGGPITENNNQSHQTKSKLQEDQLLQK